EREAWVRLGLELIDPEDSEIIVLHQWTGLPFAKIAEQLKITLEAACMRHSRAVSRLGSVVARLRHGEVYRAVGGSPE
ncbi:MAG: sigma factor-like helix-turn-helix DNA-binding protein, partial [Planctomycetota bacterium]